MKRIGSLYRAKLGSGRVYLLTAMTLLVVLAALLILGKVSSPTDDLIQQVIEDMSGLHFTSQGICAFTPEESETHDRAKEHALARLLSAPDAQKMSLAEREFVFLGGIQRIPVPFEQTAELLDEREGFTLVSMSLAFCKQSSHHRNLPALYLFSRAGEFWRLGYGVATDLTWLEDRWVGWVDISGEDGRTFYNFTHINPRAEEWEKLYYAVHVANGPGLYSWLGIPEVSYLDSYRKILIPAESVGKLGPGRNAPPCDFGDALDWLNAFYQGDLTLEWRDGKYWLTEETLYEVTVALDDGTLLSSEPAYGQRSWREFCPPNAAGIPSSATPAGPTTPTGFQEGFDLSIPTDISPQPIIPTVVPTVSPPPLQVTAIYQPYERGFMVRLSGQSCAYAYSYTLGNIIIPPELGNSLASSYAYCLEFVSLPDNTIAEPLPAGLLMPDGAFGRVWWYYTLVREQLGFAVAPEQQYTGALPPGESILGGSPFSVSVVPLPDGRVLYCGMRAATEGTCRIQ